MPTPATARELLLALMTERQLTQRELAQWLHVADSQISETLSGKRRLNLHLAKELFSRAGIPADVLFALTD